MSNLIKAINFLREKPNGRFLTIVNQSDSSQVGLKNIYLSDIPQEDLKNYIKFNLGEITKPERVWVEAREKNGTTSIKRDSFAIELQPEFRNQMPEKVETTQVAPTHVPTPLYPSVNEFLGNPHMLGSIIEPHIKAARLTDRENDLAAAKEEIKDLKQRNNLLEIDLRKALTDLSTAEAKKEMAVMVAEAKTKGFLDSQGFQTMLEKAPDIFEKIIAAKHGAQPTEQLGNPDWSRTKKDFLEVLDHLTDQQVEFLGAICFKMNDLDFANKVTQLLKSPNDA